MIETILLMVCVGLSIALYKQVKNLMDKIIK